jgi:hypothetical protein
MNAVESIIKKIDLLSLNVTPDEFKILTTHVNTVYVDIMNNHRSKIENVFDLPFPEFFAAHPEKHGKTGFGFLFEDMLIHQNNWTKLNKVGNPGDAVNDDGEHIEMKYGSVIYPNSGMPTVMWNHVTEDTKAQHFLLYAHDYRGSGLVYSFYLTKSQALKMRGKNKNNQISASLTNRPNTQWQRLQKYNIGVSDSPIVPKHLTSNRKNGRFAA